MTELRASRPSDVPTEYRSLHKYLDNRFANVVVLTFEQIEGLLGFALPDGARRLREWWVTADELPAGHSCSWTAANRTALPNLAAQNVVFERLSEQRQPSNG